MSEPVDFAADEPLDAVVCFEPESFEPESFEELDSFEELESFEEPESFDEPESLESESFEPESFEPDSLESEELDAPEPLFDALEARESVLYQPLPLNTIPTG